MSEPLSSRLATPADIAALKVLMERSISLLSPAFLSPEEVSASHEVMGLDPQLIADGTYAAELGGSCTKAAVGETLVAD